MIRRPFRTRTTTACTARYEEIEERYPQLRGADSPTMSVGGSVDSGFSEVRHLAQMMSLDDVFSLEELAGWETRMAEATGITDLEMTTEVKVDGSPSTSSTRTAALCAPRPKATATSAKTWKYPNSSFTGRGRRRKARRAGHSFCR